MAESGNNPTNPGAPGSGEGSGARRKLAGKYDTVEEAIDKGLFGLEQGFHETREQLGAIKTLIERMTVPVGTRGNGGRDDYNEDPYNRGRQNREGDEDDFDEAEFLTSPKKILRQRERRLVERTERNIINANKQMIANSAAVLRFQMRNPDLDEHEHIVEGFFKRTDSTKDIYSRLVEAGKMTRQYIAQHFKGGDDEGRGAGRAPGNDEYVEGAGRGADKQKRQEEEGEGGNVFNPDDQLAAEIAEQRAWKSKRFAAPERKPQ